MVAEGHVNKEIASTLCLSIKTVEKHRQQLMDKLSIHDIASLTRYAIANGLVECSVPARVVPPLRRATEPAPRRPRNSTARARESR